MDLGSEAADVLEAPGGLVFDRSLRPFADDQMCFNLGICQHFEESDAENGACRAGHAYNESLHATSRFRAATYRLPMSSRKSFRG